MSMLRFGRYAESFGAAAISRRSFMRVIAAGFAAIPGNGLWPGEVALAQTNAPGLPLPDELVEATIRRLFGNRAMQRGDDKIKVELPQIAEDGGGVPITIDSNLPVSGAAALSAIYIISDKNRRPLLAKFSFTPDSGRAFLSTSVRLATSTDVRVIAEMSDGTLYSVVRPVRVTISGCDLPPQS
jgi:sulfur-oxidizing protein SoxY